MEYPSHETIHINGVAELDTAIAALRVVDTDSSGAKTFETLRSVRNDLAEMNDDDSDTLKLTLQGGTTGAVKADIITGLEILSAAADTPEQKLAAQALLEVMRQED